MYELYLNGNKVKQINYIGEHDYTPVVEQVETPLITYDDQQYAEGDCSNCDNWSECGYSSYEDCDCQVNGNCE